MSNLSASILNKAFLDDELDVTSTFYRVATNPQADRCYLVELYPESLADVAGGEFLTGFLTLPFLSPTLDTEVPQNIASLYFSDRGYLSFPADSVANEFFEGRVITPLVYESRIPITPEESSRLAVQIGEIEFANQDGGLDGFQKSFAIDGRRVVVRMGEKGASYDTFGTILDATALDWLSDSNSARLRVRDNGYFMDVTLQTALYGGTGGADGGSSLAGQPKPLCFGQVFNISPIAVDPANLIFQVHSRTIQSVDAVRDKGVPITYSGSNYANYAALLAAPVTAGQYSTCLAEGLIKTGSSPEFLTCDIKGDAQGSYVNKVSDIAKRIMTDFAGLVDGTDIDASSFAVIAAQVTAISGWYFTQTTTASQAVSDFLQGSGLYWGTGRNGLLTIGRLADPALAAPALYLDETDILEIEIIPLPDSISPPNYRRRVSYQKNWTPQDSGTLAGSVSASNRLLYGQPYQVKTAVNTSVLSDYLLATDPPVVESPFYSSADASTEASRLLSAFSVQRQMFRLKVKTIGHTVYLGQAVNVTWPRFELDNGKQFVIVGIAEDCGSREITFTLWG